MSRHSRLVPSRAVAFVLALGVVLATLLAACPRIPTDAELISRFQLHRAALASTDDYAFVSPAAQRLWTQSLRIRPRRSPNGAPGLETSFIWTFGPGSYISKGYAFLPGGQLPVSGMAPSFAESLDRAYVGLRYRHIEGDWYLYLLHSR